MMKTDMDKQAALRAIFTGKSVQIGEVHVVERPAVIRWVFRCSKNRQPFDGRKFDAMLTVEDMPAFPGCIYVCNAMSAFAGGIRRMTLANRQFFIKRGYTHAYYKNEGVEHCRHLKTWRTEPVFDDAKEELSRLEVRNVPCQD
jgi:hypothetical protein